MSMGIKLTQMLSSTGTALNGWDSKDAPLQHEGDSFFPDTPPPFTVYAAPVPVLDKASGKTMWHYRSGGYNPEDQSYGRSCSQKDAQGIIDNHINFFRADEKPSKAQAATALQCIAPPFGAGVAEHARNNIKKRGIQDLRTIALAIAEECGEVAQAILDWENDECAYVEIWEENVDLAALTYQLATLMVFKDESLIRHLPANPNPAGQNNPAGREPKKEPEGTKSPNGAISHTMTGRG